MLQLVKTLSVVGAVALGVGGVALFSGSEDQPPSEVSAGPRPETVSGSGDAVLNVAEHQAVPIKTTILPPVNVCRIDVICDMPAMATVFMDPEAFLFYMDRMNTPEGMRDVLLQLMDMQNLKSIAGKMVDPDTWFETARIMTDPEGMARWVMAPTNVDNWQSALSHANPKRYVDWVSALSSREYYQPVIAIFADG